MPYGENERKQGGDSFLIQSTPVPNNIQSNHPSLLAHAALGYVP